MSNSRCSSAASIAAIVLCTWFGQAVAANAFIAGNTYEGQQAMVQSMPVRFDTKGTFKASQLTAMCPEATGYTKQFDEQFSSHGELIDAALRSPDIWGEQGKTQLKLVLDFEICKKLEPGTSVEVVGGIMNMQSCLAAWMTPDNNLKYPGNTKYGCFYVPLTKVDGVLYTVPGQHLEGYDEWAAKEWKNHKQ